MNPSLSLPEDCFLEELIDLDERLKQGESIEKESPGNATPSRLNPRVLKTLSTLKRLDQLRKRQGDSTLSLLNHVTGTDYPAATVQFPCHFGKFELLKELGRGGFGVVFLARDQLLQCEVALKIPHGHVLVNDELRERFIQEARVAASLQHHNIVPVREAGSIGPIMYIVYDYCPGITLSDWLRQQKEQVSTRLAAEWLVRLGEAVAYAHSKGVMHRDLKPSNILLVEHVPPGSSPRPAGSPGSVYIPKITDFGLAKLEKDKTRTNTGAILGTPAYMAPEQAMCSKKITPSVDIHGLGVLLYEMISGHPPFRGESDVETLKLVSHQEPLSLRKIRPRLHPDLETICLKCLQKEPKNRYQNAFDLVVDLYHYLNQMPINARPVSRWERFSRLCRKHPLVTSLFILLFLVFSAGACGILWQYHQRGLQTEATRNWLNNYLGFLRSEVSKADEMLKDIRTEKMGREKLIALLPYYETLICDPQSDRELQLEAARLAFQAGSIHVQLTEFSKAISRYLKAIDLTKQVIDSQGMTNDLLADQARTLSCIAYCYRSMHDWSHAETFYRQAVEAYKTLLHRQPNHAEHLSALSKTIVYMSYIYADSRLNQSDEEAGLLLQAKKYIEEAIQIQPEDQRFILQWALVLDDYALCKTREKKYQEAEPHMAKALQLREDLFQKDNSGFSARDALARSHTRFARWHLAQGQYGKSIECYLQALQVADETLKLFPGNLLLVNSVASTRNALAKVYVSDNQLERAIQLVREAIALRSQYGREYPHDEGNRSDWASDIFHLARLLHSQGMKSEAYAQFQIGLNLSDALSRDFPQQTRLRELYLNQLKTLAHYYQKDNMKKELDTIHVQIDQVRQQLNNIQRKD